MNIHVNNFQINTKALVPASEYKGPVLKLTAKEKSKIARLTKTKAELLLESTKLEDRLRKNTKHITKDYQWLATRLFKLESLIQDIEKAIKEIKINRLNIQKKS